MSMSRGGCRDEVLAIEDVRTPTPLTEPRTATIRPNLLVRREAVRGWEPADGYLYTVAELAKAWNVSTDFIRDLFHAEPEVVQWIRNRPGKRRYIVVRIPASVAERVYRRAQLVAGR